jgi:hypothetical protein
LLKHGGYTSWCRALRAGRLVISWYLVPEGADLASGKPKPMLVARGKASFAKPGTVKIKIKLTKAGIQVLNSGQHLKLTANGSFRPTGGPALVVTNTFTLKR